MNKYLIDTHTHIDMIESHTADEIIQLAAENNVKKMIIPGVTPDSDNVIFPLIEKYENCFGMLGVHPSEAKLYNEEAEEHIEKMLQHDKITAIGEIGLDYYWDKTFNDIQQEVFIKQIKLANKHNLPICVHDREAHKDTFDILKEYNKGSDVVLHCYSGSVEFAKECIKEGWYLGLGGVVTFKNAVKMKETAKEIPIEKIVLETDAPYLTPVPFRGKENQPAYVKYVAEEISYIKGIPLDEVAEITSQNAERIYRI